MQKNWKEFFQNKKVTIMGLGLLGRGISDSKFLAKYCKELIITDLKDEEELKDSLNELKGFNNIKYHLGKHIEEDFTSVDFILKNAAIPPDSKYLKIAKEHNIPIEMDESLFAKLKNDTVKIIGITGTRGKTTTSYLIYEFLKVLDQAVYLAGNIQGKATLPLLENIEDNAIVVLELSSWQLQGFAEAKISPDIAVWTNLYPDHLNYYKGSMQAYINDKLNIFKYQNINDYFIYNENDAVINDYLETVKSKKIAFNIEDVVGKFNFNLKGQHNLENLAAAYKVAKLFNIGDDKIQEVLDNFKAVNYRLELVAEKDNVKFYNDTTSTTPIAGLKALESFDDSEKIYLIAGGADKELDLSEWINYLSKKVEKVFLLSGSASEKIKKELQKIGKDDIIYNEYDNLTKAVKDAYELAKSGGIILLSPAAASFGMFKNEYHRGEEFNKIVKNIIINE